MPRMILVSIGTPSSVSPARAGVPGASRAAPSRQPKAARETVRRLNVAAKPVRNVSVIRSLTPLAIPRGTRVSIPDHWPGSGRFLGALPGQGLIQPVSYTHLRAHETVLDLVCRLLLEKKKKKQNTKQIT